MSEASDRISQIKARLEASRNWQGIIFTNKNLIEHGPHDLLWLITELERARAASEGVDMLIAAADRRGAVKALREAARESPQAKGALTKRADEIEYPETFGYHVEGGRAFDGQGRPL